MDQQDVPQQKNTFLVRTLIGAIVLIIVLYAAVILFKSQTRDNVGPNEGDLQTDEGTPQTNALRAISTTAVEPTSKEVEQRINALKAISDSRGDTSKNDSKIDALYNL